jgi:hypothetical protein
MPILLTWKAVEIDIREYQIKMGDNNRLTLKDFKKRIRGRKFLAFTTERRTAQAKM